MQVHPKQTTNEEISNNVYPGYETKMAIGFGIVQIIIGSIFILFNIILVINEFQVDFAFGYKGTGFWAGAIVCI